MLSLNIILNDIVFYTSTGRLMSTGGRRDDIFPGVARGCAGEGGERARRGDWLF